MTACVSGPPDEDAAADAPIEAAVTDVGFDRLNDDSSGSSDTSTPQAAHSSTTDGDATMAAGGATASQTDETPSPMPVPTAADAAPPVEPDLVQLTQKECSTGTDLPFLFMMQRFYTDEIRTALAAFDQQRRWMTCSARAAEVFVGPVFADWTHPICLSDETRQLREAIIGHEGAYGSNTIEELVSSDDVSCYTNL